MSVDVFLVPPHQPAGLVPPYHGPACSAPELWQSPENLLRHTRIPLTEAPLVLPNRPWLNPSVSSLLTAPLGVHALRRCPQGCFFPSETNLNLLNLWSPPSVPTGAVLKRAGSIPINRLMPLV